MLVTFPISVTKYSGESNLRENGFVFACSSKAQFVMVKKLAHLEHGQLVTSHPQVHSMGWLVTSHPQVLTCSCDQWRLQSMELRCSQCVGPPSPLI